MHRQNYDLLALIPPFALQILSGKLFEMHLTKCMLSEELQIGKFQNFLTLSPPQATTVARENSAVPH